MSDSVDRVFVHALATVRRLPRTGSSRPPPAARLRLYGLYKQSMEGDVSAIIARPTIPIPSPDPNAPNTVHRYASRDVRTREAQAEIEKWDAWNACAGMSRTDAKRQYISTLIETMKEYASGTTESRELVGELEFVWNQIKEQSGSGSDPENVSQGSPKSGSGQGEQESPTRKLERAGIARTQSQRAGLLQSISFSSNQPSVGSMEASGASGLGLSGSGSGGGNGNGRTKQTRLKRTESGLRVLSPVSQRDEGSVVEGVDVEEEDPEQARYDDDDDDDDQNLDTAPTSPLANRVRGRQHAPPPTDGQDLAAWQRNLEAHLHALKTEIAALREQLSANHLLSSSTYSLGGAYYTLTTRQRIIHRAKLYIRNLGALFFKQVVIQLGILTIVLLWGRIKGDLRVEVWVRDVLVRFRKKMRSVFGGIAYWLLDLFGRDGRLGFLGRILRIT